MNHWCVKQILHLVWSKNLLLLYQFTFAQNRPKSDISGALRPIHYITLKAFAMALGDRTKCKTCFECPRMVLCGPWKTILSKIEFGSGVTHPPGLVNHQTFYLIFFVKPSLSVKWENIRSWPAPVIIQDVCNKNPDEKTLQGFFGACNDFDSIEMQCVKQI